MFKSGFNHNDNLYFFVERRALASLSALKTLVCFKKHGRKLEKAILKLFAQ